MLALSWGHTWHNTTPQLAPWNHDWHTLVKIHVMGAAGVIAKQEWEAWEELEWESGKKPKSHLSAQAFQLAPGFPLYYRPAQKWQELACAVTPVTASMGDWKASAVMRRDIGVQMDVQIRAPFLSQSPSWCWYKWQLSREQCQVENCSFPQLGV